MLQKHSYLYFQLHCLLAHLHPFPTRRSSDLSALAADGLATAWWRPGGACLVARQAHGHQLVGDLVRSDRKSTRLNSSHVAISYAVFCLKKKKESFLDDYRRLIFEYRFLFYIY